MGEQRLFKELELGFRELFRILIPGAFVVSLAQALFPCAQFTQTITKSTASGLAATFFCGLVGYALRAHERWFPYFLQFEKKRAELNTEIARITVILHTCLSCSSFEHTSAKSFDHFFSRLFQKGSNSGLPGGWPYFSRPVAIPVKPPRGIATGGEKSSHSLLRDKAGERDKDGGLAQRET